MSDPEDSPKAKSQQRRWRLAFTAINFTQVLAALSKKVLDKNTRTLRALSYVAIDVHDDNPRGDHMLFLNLDQKSLTQMVKEKSLESLNQLGGVKEVAAILETDVMDGISGKEDDLAHRTDVFGTNRYLKPHTKGFLHLSSKHLKIPPLSYFWPVPYFPWYLVSSNMAGKMGGTMGEVLFLLFFL